MTKQDAIQMACNIVGLAYHSIGDYSQASDCFCSEFIGNTTYSNSGETLRFVRDAMVEKLTREGKTLAHKFDTFTGEKLK